MRARKKALAASFVVTFAAGAAGCDSKPSQPAAAPTVDVGPAPSPAAVGAAAPSDSSAGAAAPSGSTAVAALPPAPPSGRIEHNADGTCTWFPDRNIIRPGPGKVILNPPPPHQVQCPPGGSDGGT